MLTKIKQKFSFIDNLKRLFKYSKWIKKERKRLLASGNLPYYEAFETLKRESLKAKREEKGEPPIAILTCYNDIDIIEGILKENIKNGIQVIVVDNWSTDGTWEVVKKIASQETNVLKIMQYPEDGPSENYDWKKLLKKKEEIAKDYVNRWIFHQDSDEVTISPFSSIELKYVLEAVRRLNYNCITLRMLDFTPVDDNFVGGNPVEYFKFFRFITKFAYDVQEKIWYQRNERVNLNEHAGHIVVFDNKKLYPIRLPRLHYSLRSTAQMKKKYDVDRLKRSEKECKELGWHTHIKERKAEPVIFDETNLIKYEFSQLYNYYFWWFTKRD